MRYLNWTKLVVPLIVLLFYTFLILSAVRGFQLTWEDPLIHRANDFAEHYNKWSNFLNTNKRLGEISPDSPEFKRLIRARWDKEKLDKRWEALRREVGK